MYIEIPFRAKGIPLGCYRLFLRVSGLYGRIAAILDRMTSFIAFSANA
jgi:hypothetical protein